VEHDVKEDVEYEPPRTPIPDEMVYTLAEADIANCVNTGIISSFVPVLSIFVETSMCGFVLPLVGSMSYVTSSARVCLF